MESSMGFFALPRNVNTRSTAAPTTFFDRLQFITPFKNRKRVPDVPDTPKKPRQPPPTLENDDKLDDDLSFLAHCAYLTGNENFILIEESEIDDLSMADQLGEDFSEPNASQSPDPNPNPRPSSSSSPDPGPSSFDNLNPGMPCLGHACLAPSIEQAGKAVNDLLSLLRGESRGKGGGFKDPKINPFVHHRLEGMRAFLKLYSDPKSRTYGHWMDSSMQAAITMDRGTYCARMLCKLA